MYRVVKAVIASAFVSSAVMSQLTPPEILISPATPTSTDIIVALIRAAL